jgi:hypothetical protein
MQNEDIVGPSMNMVQSHMRPDYSGSFRPAHRSHTPLPYIGSSYTYTYTEDRHIIQYRYSTNSIEIWEGGGGVG